MIATAVKCDVSTVNLFECTILLRRVPSKYYFIPCEMTVK